MTRTASIVGIIVNPNAGKDIRRLVTPATHTSDVTKVGIVRRAIVAAFESGASKVLLMPDNHRLAERASDGIKGDIEVLDMPLSGSRFDTITAAHLFCQAQAGAVIALGGDGTSRDVAIGWPDAPLIAISTGTNNVFPSAIDGTSAGAAAAFVASGAVCLSVVGRRSKKVVVKVNDRDKSLDDLALVDLAFINSMFVGARAVRDPHTVHAVIACVATPASTGLSSIAGRIHPVGRWEAGGVFIRLGAGGRKIRVPLAPGSFTTMEIAEVRPLDEGEKISLSGKTMLAFDGERDLPVSEFGTVTAHIEATGPLLIDVEHTLVLAAQALMFDETARHISEENHVY